MITDQVTGQTVPGVLCSAYLNNKGNINKINYLDAGRSLLKYDDYLSIRVDVAKPKEFLKFGTTFFVLATAQVTPDNLDSFARELDSLPGVAPGNQSTYVKLLQTDTYTFA